MRVRDEIRSAVEELKVDVLELGDDAVRVIENGVERAFAEPGPGALWERLRASRGVQNSEGWRRVGEFSGGATNLLVRDAQGACAFRFARSEDIPLALAQCSGFEFYVCDDGLNYLLAFNHHDFLIGAGTAAAWLASHPRSARP
jgi:hypothetical protein